MRRYIGRTWNKVDNLIIIIKKIDLEGVEMNTENNYLKQNEEIIRPAAEQLSGELSGSSNFNIEIEEGSNLNNILSRAIAQQRNETIYSDMVKEPLGIYLNDQNNPSGHRKVVITGFVGDKLYIADPGMDGTIIDINCDQLNGEMIKNSLKKCFKI